ncbi:hypothetical protein [Winogradskyella bathintestinalis]|uniref:DUF4403 family protein n=1 Tax=Winogradskyella bathintestinalis TaxID=3035208 RepID=A0ABT7ZWS5_9FLAO|nr:hypothetical protein [Winogradskyella bathintestinalis]MDN3493452.1 hypothetical protein [Winogradskyella bathintestinalis]
MKTILSIITVICMTFSIQANDSNNPKIDKGKNLRSYFFADMSISSIKADVEANDRSYFMTGSFTAIKAPNAKQGDVAHTVDVSFRNELIISKSGNDYIQVNAQAKRNDNNSNNEFRIYVNQDNGGQGKIDKSNIKVNWKTGSTEVANKLTNVSIIYQEDSILIVGTTQKGGYTIGVTLAIAKAPVASKGFTISKTLFTGFVNAYLGNMEIKLNNYGSRYRDTAGDISWFVENESFVELGGNRFNFNIPEYTRGVRDKKYYMNNMNLNSAISSFNGDQLNLVLIFEEDGAELKGMCSNCAKFREDNAAPDYQLDDNRWNVQLNVVPFNGSLTLEVVDVSYLGDVDGAVFGELFEGIVKKTVIPIMESEFRNAFNDQRAEIARQIRTLADSANIDLASVTSITFEGGNIVLHTNRS